MRRIASVFLILIMITAASGCSVEDAPIATPKPEITESVEPTPTAEPTEAPIEYLYEIPGIALTDEQILEEIETILSLMTIEEKAAQMVQGKREATFAKDIIEYGVGSILSGGGSFPGEGTVEQWRDHVTMLQDAAMNRPVQIPIIYGIDAVHGNDHILDSVIFPHNIGLGAANDEQLMYELGSAVANQTSVTMVTWNFAPCVAVSLDPRWGRTYESISSDTDLVTRLQNAYMQGLQDNGVAACAKHYLGDGGTVFGTGDNGYRIDRGDVQMSEEEFRALFLPPYETLVENGVLTVMVSYSSFNGVKMHENGYFINDVLKGELGFEGMVVSDWEGHFEIDEPNYGLKVIKAINSGIDMLMEPSNWELAIRTITTAVEDGSITMERIDDAVTRVLWVKFKNGLFENPYPENDFDIGSDVTKKLAVELVEKSAVLLKNNNDLLPLKEGTTVLVTGPAMDNIGVQCGGWTEKWFGALDGANKITAGTTLLEGLEQLAIDRDITIVTDVGLIDEVDVVLIAIGEKPYAEGTGDDADPSLTGHKILSGTKEAIELARDSGKPTVSIIMAGRNIILHDNIDDWDSLVMAYLPGSEGLGLANVIMGETGFTGTLPMPWYLTVEDIDKSDPEYLYEIGYGIITK